MIKTLSIHGEIPEDMIPIVRTLRTKNERDGAQDAIVQLEAALFRSDAKGMEKVLRTRFSSETAHALNDVIERADMKENPGAVNAFLKNLRDTLETLLLLKLSIAFKPMEEHIDRLSLWTRQNLGQGILLDIGYDKSMVGGARIIFKGKYKEMTLAQMITDVLAKERNAIRKIIT